MPERQVFAIYQNLLDTLQAVHGHTQTWARSDLEDQDRDLIFIFKIKLF